ncbi:MAG: HEAT repeat domain-containing protein [Armatimonadetes bacterium]|nr:HEAT repeat domain-containing protein [Armatimonadota bacterium]
MHRLGALGPRAVPAASSALLSGAPGPEGQTARRAAWALGDIGGEAALNALALALRREDTRVAFAAVFGLTHLGTEEALEVLWKGVLANGTPGVQLYAVECLCFPSSRHKVQALERLVAAPALDGRARHRAMECLSGGGPDDHPPPGHG